MAVEAYQPNYSWAREDPNPVGEKHLDEHISWKEGKFYFDSTMIPASDCRVERQIRLDVLLEKPIGDSFFVSR
jgi:hypothetical protein